MYGVMAEFATPEALVAAARQARDEGYHDMEAYSPYPIEDLEHELPRWNPLPLFVLLGGLAGAATGFGLQCYIAIWNYPINVAGRPLYSWPAFIVITFELTVLFAAVTAVFGMLFLAGLPKPYHPVATSPRFEEASRDRFFLCIQATDSRFDATSTRRFLSTLDPEGIEDVGA